MNWYKKQPWLMPHPGPRVVSPAGMGRDTPRPWNQTAVSDHLYQEARRLKNLCDAWEQRWPRKRPRVRGKWPRTFGYGVTFAKPVRRPAWREPPAQQIRKYTDWRAQIDVLSYCLSRAYLTSALSLRDCLINLAHEYCEVPPGRICPKHYLQCRADKIAALLVWLIRHHGPVYEPPAIPSAFWEWPAFYRRQFQRYGYFEHRDDWDMERLAHRLMCNEHHTLPDEGLSDCDQLENDRMEKAEPFRKEVARLLLLKCKAPAAMSAASWSPDEVFDDLCADELVVLYRMKSWLDTNDQEPVNGKLQAIIDPGFVMDFAELALYAELKQAKHLTARSVLFAALDRAGQHPHIPADCPNADDYRAGIASVTARLTERYLKASRYLPDLKAR